MRLITYLIITIVYVSFFPVGCGYQDTEDATSSELPRETRAQEGISNNENKTPVDTIPIRSGEQIIGIWQTTDKEILTVDISKDSIFYTEHFESHKYQIKGDSIYINYYDFLYSGRPYTIKDTLIFSSIDGEAKYIRVKKE